MEIGFTWPRSSSVFSPSVTLEFSFRIKIRAMVIILIVVHSPNNSGHLGTKKLEFRSSAD